MKKPIILLLMTCLLALIVGLSGQSSTENAISTNHLISEVPKTIIRNCVVDGQLYFVKYEYNSMSAGFVPATNPPGQPHYPCKVTIYKAEQVGSAFGGQVTENGCIEDVPEDMVRHAISQKK